MATRAQQKQKTRQSLIEAVLTLVSKGQHFTSISIREAAREAGVVPTSFYRHFDDMNELAIAIIDELSLLLRRLMREARHDSSTPLRMIPDSAQLYIKSVNEHRPYFMFMSQALATHNHDIYRMMHNELNYFAQELNSDLTEMGLLNALDSHVLDELCYHTIHLVANSTGEILATSEEHTQKLNSISKRIQSGLMLLFKGAANWPAEELN